jgi:hypothetical protein
MNQASIVRICMCSVLYKNRRGSRTWGRSKINIETVAKLTFILETTACPAICNQQALQTTTDKIVA